MAIFCQTVALIVKNKIEIIFISEEYFVALIFNSNL